MWRETVTSPAVGKIGPLTHSIPVQATRRKHWNTSKGEATKGK